MPGYRGFRGVAVCIMKTFRVCVRSGASGMRMGLTCWMLTRHQARPCSGPPSLASTPAAFYASARILLPVPADSESDSELGLGSGPGTPSHWQAAGSASFCLAGPSPLADFKLAKRRVEAPRAPAPAWTLTEAQARACGELSNGEYHAQYERTRSSGWVWTGRLEARQGVGC